MLALLGASPAQAEALAARHGVAIANDNAPGQVVLSGSPDALDAARKDATTAGLRALPLGVAGAFHSPQMQGAVEPFRAALTEVVFETPRDPGDQLRDRQAVRRPRRSSSPRRSSRRCAGATR